MLVGVLGTWPVTIKTREEEEQWKSNGRKKSRIRKGKV